jgi:hypothetical protein
MTTIFAIGTKSMEARNKMNKESVQGAERLLILSDKLDDIVSELDDVCVELKKVEESKKQLREIFFELADEYLEISGVLKIQVLEEKCASRADAEKLVKDGYPGWRISQYDENQIVIEEDPVEMKFEWINPEGYQLSRTTAVVGTTFDYSKLEEHNPEIFEQIVEKKIVYELNEKKAMRIIDENPEYLSVLQEATKLGKIQLRLSSPKKVEDK